jgi:hypothetical protein
VIGRWVIKILVVIALIGVLGFELLSPVFIRFQIDGTAHDAADSAAIEYMQTKKSDMARSTADDIVAKEDGAHIDAFEISDTGEVSVTVSKQAKSYLLYKIRRARSWYDVKVKAKSVAK